MQENFGHYSVLLEETIENLNIRPNGTYVDCTLGGAGHSEAILKRLTDGGRLIGIDRDSYALEKAAERLARFGSQAVLVKGNFVMPLICFVKKVSKPSTVLWPTSAFRRFSLITPTAAFRICTTRRSICVCRRARA